MKFLRIRHCKRFKLALTQQTLSFCSGFLLACLLTFIPPSDPEQRIFCDRSWLQSEILEITNIFKKPEPHEEGMYFFNSNVNDSKYSSEPDAKYWKTFDILRESFELPRSSVKQPRLLCWMMTDPDILEKARPAQLTWFSKCDVPLIFSSDENDAFPTIGLKAPPGRKSIAAKAHLAWEHVYRNYKDKADFFMKADPDSYVFVNNLKRFLSNRSPSHVGLYGHALYVDLSNHSFYRRFKGYYAAGEGYVMSKEALASFMKVIDICPLINGTAEDLKTSICLSMVGVDLTDTRDFTGRETFLPPLSLRNIAISLLPKWYKTKYRRFIGYCSNLTCLSAYPIVTHYVKKSEMYVLEYMSRVIDELTEQINITGSPNYHFRGLLHVRSQHL